MQKKVLALILACSMMFSMAMPAMAADTEHGEEIVVDSGDNTWDGGGADGEVAVPKLVMSMPTFDADTLKFDVYNQLNGAQIVSKDLSFTNWSTVPVKIALQKYSAYTTSATPIVGMTSPDAIQGDADRNLFLWFNAAEKDAAGNLVDADSSTEGVQFKYPAVGDVAAATVTARAIEKYEVSKPATPAVEQITTPEAFDQIEAGAIPAAGLVGDPTFKTLEEVGTTNKLTVKFDGAINTKGKWAADEKITVVPVFSIEMQAITPVESVSTASALLIGDTDPSIVIKGKGFEVVSTPTAITGKVTVDVGTTGLTITTYTATADTMTIGFTGTIGKGTLTVQPLASAFTANAMDGKKLTIFATNEKPVMTVVAAPTAMLLTRASGATINLTMPKSDEIVKATATGTDVTATIAGKTVTVTTVTVAGGTVTLGGVKCATAVAGDVMTIALKASALAGNDYPLPDAVTTTVA